MSSGSSPLAMRMTSFVRTLMPVPPLSGLMGVVPTRWNRRGERTFRPRATITWDAANSPCYGGLRNARGWTEAVKCKWNNRPSWSSVEITELCDCPTFTDICQWGSMEGAHNLAIAGVTTQCLRDGTARQGWPEGESRC